MKKFNLLLIAILLLTLAGCQVQSPVNKNATNGNGSIAVNVQSDSPIPSEPETPGLTADASAPLPANPPAFDSGDTKPVASGDILEIKEKMFVAQTNDIYYNAEDYLGKTLKYEGLFTVYTDPETDVTYYSVIRYGPGCCGIDANCGFEVKWDQAYPQADDWCEVAGILEEYEEDGYNYLRLALTSLTVLDERGAEYVAQ